VTPDLKLILVAEFRKKTLDKNDVGKMGVERRRQLKKVITFRCDNFRRSSDLFFTRKMD